MVGMSTGCLARIQKFLLTDSHIAEEGFPSQNVHHSDGEVSESIELTDYHQKNTKDLAMTLKNATVAPSQESSPVLHNINLQIEKGSLTMIVGVVGAGKSTLLKAIIGELRCSTGSIEVDAKHMGYCAQTPWLPNSTVRQIVCGYDDPVEDRKWYDEVLHACSFDEDVLLLPDRDDTIIGSRGVTLSGGQKQRLVCNWLAIRLNLTDILQALARAIYSHLSIMVLDDILSAIDARTEQLVVERLFGKAGLLRRINSTIILATHASEHNPVEFRIYRC